MVPMPDQELESFEQAAHENGSSWWSARWLMRTLEYATWPSFKTVISRALMSCASLGLDITENFPAYRRVRGDGSTEEDFKLSRFACFLIANHADSRKQGVEQAKLYLASVAAAALEMNPDILERMKEREVLSVGEKAMSSAARKAGVRPVDLALFKDAGYRGMYNMSLSRLKRHKGLGDGNKKTLYDFMGVTELAANSFRVTQTAERLRRYPVNGLPQAEGIAKGVGAEVRKMMMSSGGTAPEDLELERDIGQEKRVLEKASREMAKIDKPKKGKRSKKKLPRPKAN